MNSRGGGTGFDATDMDAPSSQLIAFVNLDSHSQHFDDSLFTHTTFLSLPLCCIIYLFGTTLSYCLQLYVMSYAIVVSCSPVVIGGGVGACSLPNYVYWYRSNSGGSIKRQANPGGPLHHDGAK